MFKSLVRDRKLVILLLLALLVRLFSSREDWVEQFYSRGLYPHIAGFFRLILGWIPFSVGDLLYFSAFILLVYTTWKYVRVIARKQFSRAVAGAFLGSLVKLVLVIYLLFNLCWGLNYNRQGIARQLELKVQPYNMNALYELTLLLKDRLSHYALLTDTARRQQWLDDRHLFEQGERDYRVARDSFPFLDYRHPSVKASLYGQAGKYFGYTGYYNPFTGEAQVKTSIPVFMRAFVLNHEIGHQLGYAKENEASFVSFLVSKNSAEVDVRYSLYYELFFTALRQMFNREHRKENIQAFVAMLLSLPPRVRNDLMEERAYARKNKNFVAPFMSDAYDKYLKFNNQPQGMATYNEVIALLMAYVKKYGKERL